MEILSSRRPSEPDESNPSQSPISNLQSPLSPRVEKFALLLILSVALFLRLYCLIGSSYWHDEGNTWALVQRGFAQIAADAAADIHPPGYYWLLKVWSLVFGVNPWALRLFSALAGTLTVAVVYAIGKAVTGDWGLETGERALIPSPQSPISNPHSPLPLLAALLAALNPFQIFYSQEARMYSLLMLESAALVWIALEEGKRQKGKAKVGYITPSQFTIHNSQFIILFALIAVAGLWTHYIFPVVLAAVGVAYLWHWMRLKADDRRQTADDEQSLITQSPNRPIPNLQSLIPFLLAILLAILLYLPWLPTAIDRVLHWPAGGVDISTLDGLRLTLQTLAVGPIRSGPELAWPWLLLVGLLPLIGLWRLRRNPAAPFLALWLLAPVGLMFGLGLYTDSFLKFLLVVSPAWCVLTAYCVVRSAYFDSRRGAETQRESHVSRFTQYASIATTYAIRTRPYAFALAALLLAVVTLPAYYADPAARDNYAGMAATVAALGDSATDVVILNAPGQADVWAIYDPGLPVLALPNQRPPDRSETEAALTAAVAERRQIFALFWATEQSDPEGIVEGWLNRYAFKGLESWQGNVRFVQYSLPNQMACQEFTPPIGFGEAIQLTRLCLPAERRLAGGTSLPIALYWQTDLPIAQRYKATLQLLNQQNQVIGQQDGEPGGGGLPTTGWQPGAQIVDKRGVYVPVGAPPVEYRLILALYDAETGKRLPVAGGDALALGAVTLSRPTRTLPAGIVPMRGRLNQPVGPLTLTGFDAYANGYAHDPTHPVAPGELLHVTLYWQAPSPLPTEWPADLSFTLSLGNEQVSAALTGPAFPTGAWQAGDFVRGDADILHQGDGPLVLYVGGAEIPLGRLVNGRLH